MTLVACENWASLECLECVMGDNGDIDVVRLCPQNCPEIVDIEERSQDEDIAREVNGEAIAREVVPEAIAVEVVPEAIAPRPTKWGRCDQCGLARHVAMNHATNEAFLGCNGYRKKPPSCLRAVPIPEDLKPNLPLFWLRRMQVEF